MARNMRKSHMKFVITNYQDEDGMFIAECPAIPGCISQGASQEEAEKNIQDAIKECLAVRKEKGMPLTVTTRKIEDRSSAVFVDTYQVVRLLSGTGMRV